MIALCEVCFPNWREHEVEAFVPTTACAACGAYDLRHKGGLWVNLFAGDPRYVPAAPKPEGRYNRKCAMLGCSAEAWSDDGYCMVHSAKPAPTAPAPDDLLRRLSIPLVYDVSPTFMRENLALANKDRANAADAIESLRVKLAAKADYAERMDALAEERLQRAERAEAENAALRECLENVVQMADEVLLDPDGRVSIDGSTGDCSVIQAAIDAARATVGDKP